MDIISDLTELITEIFDAAAEFHEDLTRLDALETRLTKAGTSFVAKSLGKILEDADLFIMEAPHRKDLYNIQRKIARCLISCAGDVYYERTQVLNKADGTYHFLLDEMMKLPPDEHFTEGAEARILQDAAEASYSKAAERISTENQTVSKVTVMNKVHEILEELPLEEPAEKRCCSHLYIEADEDHIHRQDGGKELRGACIQGKLVYVFEGKESVREGRKELVNPFFFGGRYAGPEENARLWEQDRDRSHREKCLCSGPLPPDEVYQRRSAADAGRRRRSQREDLQVHLQEQTREAAETVPAHEEIRIRPGSGHCMRKLSGEQLGSHPPGVHR